jgi:hypothetical protein
LFDGFIPVLCGGRSDTRRERGIDRFLFGTVSGILRPLSVSWTTATDGAARLAGRRGRGVNPHHGAGAIAILARFPLVEVTLTGYAGRDRQAIDEIDFFAFQPEADLVVTHGKVRRVVSLPVRFQDPVPGDSGILPVDNDLRVSYRSTHVIQHRPHDSTELGIRRNGEQDDKDEQCQDSVSWFHLDPPLT